MAEGGGVVFSVGVKIFKTKGNGGGGVFFFFNTKELRGINLESVVSTLLLPFC